LQKSLRQYSCQNHSLGYELEVAGYPALAKDKFDLSEKERTICEKISLLLRLGRVELTLDSPDFLSLQSIFADDSDEGDEDWIEETDPDPPRKGQMDSPTRSGVDPEGDDGHQIKRPRLSSGVSSSPSHFPLLVLDSPSASDHFTHTATEGEWTPHTPEKDQTSSSPLAQKSPLSSSPQQQQQERQPEEDHTVVGSLSQEPETGPPIPNPNELNHSATSISSSVHGSSSLVHSTPSPELITQSRNSKLRRYHSEEKESFQVQQHQPAQAHLIGSSGLFDLPSPSEGISKRSITQ
jgi:hypothetical protein